jgi:hypothetical protein
MRHEKMMLRGRKGCKVETTDLKDMNGEEMEL